jgi:hypothetical protein
VRLRATGRGKSNAYIRKSSFEVGLPLQFDQDYDGVTSLELVLAALGADLVNGLRELARRRRVEIHEVEALVSGRVNNPLTHLGVVGESGHPGLEQAGVRVYVASDEDEATIRRLWDEMIAKSPLVHTLRPTVDLELSLNVTP